MNKRNGARPKKRGLKTKPVDMTARMAHLLDDLREFEEFRTSLLPAIRRDLQAGMPADELRKKYKAVIQARQIMTAITGDDKAALAAAKDIIDRTDGKATEKKEITHKFDDLSTEELKAILQSEEQDLEHLMEHTKQGH